jgi:hypothetical protein
VAGSGLNSSRAAHQGVAARSRRTCGRRGAGAGGKDAQGGGGGDQKAFQSGGRPVSGVCVHDWQSPGRPISHRNLKLHPGKGRSIREIGPASLVSWRFVRINLESF